MFNTETPPKCENRLLELARQDLAMARDNLYRARMAAKGIDISQQWGQSGESLAEIIAGYENWEASELRTVAEAERLTR